MTPARCAVRLVCATIALAVMSACTAQPPGYPAQRTSSAQPIQVVKRDLTPTVSMDAQVVASPVLLVLAPVAGKLSETRQPGDAVSAGQPIASIDGQSVAAPFDGTVVTVLAEVDQAVPVNLPLLAVRYAGFGLSGIPTQWAQALLYQPDSSAKGQITNGSPFACAGLGPNAEQGDGTQPAGWICLVPKDVPAAQGESGVMVATGSVAKGVIAVPVNAVAGRQGNGQVTLMRAGQPKIVDVKLGRTDGTYIEVTSGLSEGDMISPVAPNLTVKGPA